MAGQRAIKRGYTHEKPFSNAKNNVRLVRVYSSLQRVVNIHPWRECMPRYCVKQDLIQWGFLDGYRFHGRKRFFRRDKGVARFWYIVAGRLRKQENDREKHRRSSGAHPRPAHRFRTCQ